MSDYRQEGTGKVITEQQLLKLAAESSFSVEEIIEKNNLKLITEDSGNTTGAATTTANVVPANQAVNTDSTLENGSSESQDPDPKNFTKRDSLVFNIQETEKQINNYIAKGGEVNASDAAVLQGYKDELFKLDQNDLVGTDFSSDKFEKLQDKEKIKLQEAASNEIERQYSYDGTVEFEITPKEIDEKAKEILQEKIDPNGGLGRAYTRALEIGFNNVGSMLSSIPETVYNVFATPQNIVAYLTGDESWATDSDNFKKNFNIENKLLDHYDEEVEKLSKEQEKFKQEKFEGKTGVYENFKEGNVSEGFTLLGLGLAESAPVSLSMMAGGAVAGSAAKLTAATTPFFIEQARAELKEENPDMSAAELTFKAVGIAGAETVFSAISNKALTNVYKDIIKKEGTEVGTKLFKDGIVKMYTTALKKYGAGAGMIGEGLEEVATQMTQNAFKGKDITEGASDAFLLGVAGGGVYSSPTNIMQIKNYASTKIATNKINDIIIADGKEKSINLVFDKSMAEPITSIQLDVINVKNAEKALLKNLKVGVKEGSITKEQAAQSLSKFKQTQSLDNQIKKTKLDLSPTENVEVINLLSEKIDLQKQIKDVDPALVSSQKERINEIDESISKTVVAASKVKLQAETKIVEKLVGKEKVKSFDTVEEFVEKTGERPDADAYIAKDGSVFINTQRAAKVGAFSAASHELLHRVIKSTFSDKVASTKLVKDFNKVLEKEGYLDVVQKRIDDNYRYNEDGSEKAFEEYAEEYLTSFSDAIATGGIEFNENKFKKFMQPIVNFLRKIGYSEIEFKDGRDVYDFIKDYRKNIEKGELSKRAQALQDKGEQVEGSVAKPSATKFNQQLEQLETDYDNNEIDFDVYEQQKANLEDKIERAEKAEATTVSEKPKAVAKPKPTKESNQVLKESTAKSKKELDDIGNNPDGFNKDNPKIYTTLRGLIKSKSLVFKTKKGNIVNLNSLPGFNMDNMVSETIANMLPYVAKFDPKQNNSLFGYLMAQLNNRMKGALNTGRVTDSAFDVDVSEAKGITASETTAPAAPEKTKYKNLVQQKVLSTDGLKTVRDKVISSVRVLKSKFDASVTKNVSVPPIIAEIKKDIGKQADIVLKKEMGGIKNNELQNYLKANKKAILENMTTFYLTKAFPEAIQKSVGGKYLLDKDGKRVINTFGDATFVPNFVNSDVWKGAKIDREKTSTEAKGKTSGNEIIRRVPNISQTISDELFLSSIIGSDGKPIRGRKESLAKAMGEEIAFDIINQDLKTDGPISEALKNNQEALGVVITENFEEDMSRQIERGNIKFSISNDIKAGVAILQENNMDKSSMAYNNWYDSLNSEAKGFWDKEFLPMFSKMDNATRRHFVKNGEELSKTFPSLKKGIEEYNKAFLGSSNPKSNPEVATEQLVSFQDGLSEIIGNSLSKIKGFKVYGKSTRIGDLSDKAKNNLTKSPSKESEILKKAREAAEASIDKAILYKSGKEVNRINDFITNSIDGNPSDVAAAFEKALGKETREAKEANALIFDYVNLAALEYVVNSKDTNKAFSGYLRWLETNNNNSAGLKSLAFVDGFEIVKNQAVYLNSKGKKYYSKGGLKVLENFDNGKGLKVNKEHTNWKEAESFLSKEGFLKNTTGLQRDKMIASALEIMGEHQQSMGETGIRLSIALAETLQSIENGVSVEVAKENYNLKTKQIYSNFGLIFNSRFIGSIQNKTLGLTSTLKKSRLFAVDKKISDNFFTVKGEKLTQEGKKELNEVVENVVKAKETASINDKVEKAQKATPKYSLTKEFNSIIERNKGVAADVNYSKIVAKRMGAGIGKYKFYIPSSAEDFRLLTGYTFSGKGKQGTKDMAWFDKNLIRPYTEGIAAIDIAKQTTKNDFKALNKAMPDIAKTIGDLIPTKDYTNDQAVRVYLWNKAGYSIPGLNEKEVGALVSYVSGNPELALYADSLVTISKSNEWLKPGEHWDVGTILSDINNLTEKGGRKAYLAQWIENVNEIFSDQNLNKIEALYGKRHVEALKDSLYRMKNGTNRPSGSNAQVNRWNNWLNNSIGSIMFFNRRSALLQLLSTSNFLNWSDNNPVKAAAAFANQKQYWKDFSTLFNSDKLKQRRGGLRADVNEAEIASAAANSKNKAVAALSWLLKKGFTPTQIADSFAISSGGATFYRNRINTYLSEKDADGNNIFTEKQAEEKAFLDFIETSDQSQQSSDPSLVSMEQASILGRLVLAFQNTTQQYSRVMKRSALDIIKRRQMPGTTSMLQSDFSNFSRIMYYGAIQNLIFNSLSAAIFALIPGFGEEEEEEEIDKSTAEKLKRITNGSIDSILKGLGVRGAVVAQIKNTIMEYFKQKDKGYRADHAYTIIQAVNLSPPIGSKIKKMYSAITGYKYGSGLMEQRGLDLTANGRLNLSPSYAVLGSLASGVANVPLDRMYAEIQGMSEMFDSRNTAYQRLALALGFRSWDVNAKNEEDDLIKAQLKEGRKIKQKEKAKTKRVEASKQKIVDRRKAYESLTDGQKRYILSLGKNARKKALDKQAKRLKEK